MPVRTATHRISTITDFIKEYTSALKLNVLVLKPGELEDEPASEIRVDFILPLVGRKGPVRAQLLQRNPDGSFAFRIPEPPAELSEGYQKIFEIIREVKVLLLAAGEVVLPGSQAASSPRAATTPGGRTSAEGPRAAPKAGRGYPLPDMHGRQPLLQGVLGDRTLRDSLLQVAFGKKTGLLTVLPREGPRRFGFWFHGGPVGWRTEPLDESEVLGSLLFRAGKVDSDAIGESLRTMEKEGIRQGEALLRAGLLTFPQLVLVLQKQVEFIFQKVMRLRDGNWAFFETESLPENFITPPLRVPSIQYRALKAYTMDLAVETISQTHRPNLDKYVFLNPDAVGVLDEVAFTGPEKKFLSILQSNSWRLREIFSVSNLSRTETANTLWALNEMCFLDYREEETSERYLSRVGTRISQKVGQLRTGTHFDILEVHWICVTEDVEAAYRRLKGEFVPANYSNIPPELEEALGRIQAGLDKAYEAINKDYTRRAYREEIIERTQIEQSAEVLSRKGEMAILKNDRREALACFVKASELMPKVTAYKEGIERARRV